MLAGTGACVVVVVPAPVELLVELLDPPALVVLLALGVLELVVTVVPVPDGLPALEQLPAAPAIATRANNDNTLRCAKPPTDGITEPNPRCLCLAAL